VVAAFFFSIPSKATSLMENREMFLQRLSIALFQYGWASGGSLRILVF
jgi:hypothetical protein